MTAAVFAVIAGLLLASACVALMVAMLRVAKNQRTRTRRMDGGRYSDFGFLLGILRSTDHKAGERERGGDERVDR